VSLPYFFDANDEKTCFSDEKNKKTLLTLAKKSRIFSR
jgi:hypothetical protein